MTSNLSDLLSAILVGTKIKRRRKILINYANELFAEKQKCNTQSGLNVGGFDKVYSFGPSDIDIDFFERNRGILSQRRGNGYWLWKPYFIYRILSEVDYGDFVMYVDSGGQFLQTVDKLVNLTLSSKNKILLFTLEDFHPNGRWTKRDCFHYLGLDEEYRYLPQILGGFIPLIKTEKNLKLIKEWLDYATDERIITDMENTCGKTNFPEFTDHRHDQSIISLLARKHQIDTIPDISQWGNDRDRERRGLGQVINLIR